MPIGSDDPKTVVAVDGRLGSPDSGWTPRRAGIAQEIEAELDRQGFKPAMLTPGGSFDVRKLAKAVDEKLHG